MALANYTTGLSRASDAPLPWTRQLVQKILEVLVHCSSATSGPLPFGGGFTSVSRAFVWRCRRLFVDDEKSRELLLRLMEPPWLWLCLVQVTKIILIVKRAQLRHILSHWESDIMPLDTG